MIEWTLPDGGAVGYPNETLYGYNLTVSFDFSEDVTWSTLDINGDKKPDLVVTSKDYYSFDVNNNQHWRVYLNTDSGFSTAAIECTLPDGGAQGYPNETLYGYNLTANFDFSEDVTWSTFDINGDEKPDLVVTSKDYYSFDVNNNQHWRVYLNTGSTLGTTDLNNGRNLEIFPNPTEDFIEINLSDLNFSDIIIFNSLGQVIYHENNIEEDVFKFDLSALNNGVYFVQVRIENKYIKTAKVIKK